MPFIYRQQEGRWAAQPIAGSPHDLVLAPARVDRVGESDDPGAFAGAGLLMRAMRDDSAWVLLVRDGERVLHNGQRVTAGLRVLAHRDSLALEGEAPVFFSTEEAPCIAPFAALEKVTCPRCRDALSPGELAVKCPACGVFHHETGERNCWTYASTCALCTQPSALDAGLQWTPEAL